MKSDNDYIKDLEALVEERKRLIDAETKKKVPNLLIINHHKERMEISQNLLRVARSY